MPTAPGADGLAGKEVCVCMHKASIAKVSSDEMQVRKEGGRKGEREKEEDGQVTHMRVS
jgi:hypothetical protein